MPRPCKKKCVSSIPSYTAFIHTDDPIPASHIQMSVEEYETIRLIDYLGWNQEECAKQMQTSRGSVQSLYNEARRKLSRFLMEGSAMVIAGGNYQLDLAQKPTGDDSMKIAVTYDNGQVFQHFGHTETFKIYDVEEGKVVHSEVVDTNGSGHGALAGVLNALNADVLICGGIGGGAQTALAAAGIKLFGGVSGDADEAVEAFINETLEYNPDVKCSHHEHNHGEGHTCGEHGCGSHSCH